MRGDRTRRREHELEEMRDVSARPEGWADRTSEGRHTEESISILVTVEIKGHVMLRSACELVGSDSTHHGTRWDSGTDAQR